MWLKSLDASKKPIKSMEFCLLCLKIPLGQEYTTQYNVFIWDQTDSQS